MRTENKVAFHLHRLMMGSLIFVIFLFPLLLINAIYLFGTEQTFTYSWFHIFTIFLMIAVIYICGWIFEFATNTKMIVVNE